MKKTLIILFLISAYRSYSQTIPEKEILKLSDRIFSWEVNGKIDSLEKIFHDQFIVVGSDGNPQFKNDYLNRLRSGAFVHDSIRVEKSSASVSGNTAILTGMGTFQVRISGKKIKLHLSFMEVFTRPDSKKSWQVIAMKANSI